MICDTLKTSFFLLTDGTGELACALLQQPDYLSLLGGGAPAANHSGALTGQLHELVLVVLQTNLAESRQRRQVSSLSHRIQLILGGGP